MASAETEFVSARNVAVFANISPGRDFYRSYVDACEALGIGNARTNEPNAMRGKAMKPPWLVLP